MRERNGSAVGLLMIGIAAVFLAGFLLLVIFGAQSYKAAVAGKDANMSRRALQSYLSTAIKGFDREGAVTIENRESGDVLVISDGSGYAIHIYCSGGELLEDYAPVGAELSAERAQVIGRTDSFSAVRGDDGTIYLYTDAGRVLLRLRSGGDEK